MGSKKNRKRVGRGISAGQGKTAGRGTKGQGSRSGEGGTLYRQGGNLPFYRRLPFMRGEGFTPPNQVEFNEVNLDQLVECLQGECRSDPGSSRPQLICSATRATRSWSLVAARSMSPSKCASTASAAGAKAKIEKAGGCVELIA